MRRIALPVAMLAAALIATPALETPLAAQTQAGTSAKPALNDPTIVAIFDATNTQDIETGQLAAKQGSTKAVRDFGAMLARDHTNVREQGRALAKRLGVTPTPPAGDESARAHAATMRQLRRLHGAAFEKAFLEHEVAFHQSVIDAVNTTLMPAIQNDELKHLVTVVAPAFAAHRDAAKHLLEIVK
ncbi:MAG TPA: DUF4142 domain-containing protein [Gemmatimonadaceae bacterium]|nr:DUF4142 domain-containing protein [Gemmatimonadaceae bacterium]